jgi:chaperone BCS1
VSFEPHEPALSSNIMRSIDDAYLHRLAAAVPRGSILLIEDIDCAFPSRDAEVNEEEPAPVMMASSRGGRDVVAPATVGRVTMSGVLNLMDGVGSDDGRIIFATVRTPLSMAGLKHAHFAH